MSLDMHCISHLGSIENKVIRTFQVLYSQSGALSQDPLLEYLSGACSSTFMMIAVVLCVDRAKNVLK